LCKIFNKHYGCDSLSYQTICYQTLFEIHQEEVRRNLGVLHLKSILNRGRYWTRFKSLRRLFKKNYLHLSGPKRFHFSKYELYSVPDLSSDGSIQMDTDYIFYRYCYNNDRSTNTIPLRFYREAFTITTLSCMLIGNRGECRGQYLTKTKTNDLTETNEVKYRPDNWHDTPLIVTKKLTSLLHSHVTLQDITNCIVKDRISSYLIINISINVMDNHLNLVCRYDNSPILQWSSFVANDIINYDALLNNDGEYIYDIYPPRERLERYVSECLNGQPGVESRSNNYLGNPTDFISVSREQSKAQEDLMINRKLRKLSNRCIRKKVKKIPRVHKNRFLIY
jgi:hypothetical protein